MRSNAKGAFAGAALAVILAGSAAPLYAAPGGGHSHPNGPPPVGKPATQGDTDRGHSEGEGHNDLHPARLVARIVSHSGSTLVVRTSDGVLRRLTAGPSLFTVVRPAPGANVVLMTNGGVLVERVMPADVVFSGVVTRMSRDEVTFRLPNGQLRTITVAHAAVAHMMPGRRLVVESHDGGFTATSVRPAPK